MKMEIKGTLTEKDIKQAIIEYVERMENDMRVKEVRIKCGELKK